MVISAKSTYFEYPQYEDYKRMDQRVEEKLEKQEEKQDSEEDLPVASEMRCERVEE